MKAAWALILALAAGAVGCAPAASRGGMDSDNPAAKLYAIRQAGESGDLRHVPALVQELEHDDPAVRMMAINALERLTGERKGYNPYASEAERRPAVQAWVRFVREGVAREKREE